MRDNYPRYDYHNDIELKYARDQQRSNPNANFRQTNMQDYLSKPELTQKQTRIKSIYAVPLVESKMGRESFTKPDEKGPVQYPKARKNYE